MRLTKLIIVAMIVFAMGTAQAAEKYAFDTAHSHIGFKVRHLVISKTKGAFGDFKGTLNYVPEDVAKSSINVEIQVASIDTDNEDRDNHLKSPDFFDVAKFPVITFKSEKIEKRGDGYVATGKFKIKDVEKTIELPFEITGSVTDPWGNKRIGVEGEITIDRTEYGLTWNKALETGGVVVGTDVEIELSVEFIAEK